MPLTRTVRADLDTIALTTTPTRIPALEHVAPLLQGAWHDVLLEVDVDLSGSGGRLMLACSLGDPNDPANVSEPMPYQLTEPVTAVTLSNAHAAAVLADGTSVHCGVLVWVEGDDPDVHLRHGESRLTVYPRLAMQGLPAPLLVPIGYGD